MGRAFLRVATLLLGVSTVPACGGGGGGGGGVPGNQAPSITGVVLSPDPAITTDTLLATPTGWADPDGDPPGYLYAWTVNAVPAGGNTNSLSSALYAKGDSVVCTVTPNDGTASGTPVASPAIIISNSPPSISSVALSPDPANTTDTLLATPTGWADLDGDVPGYVYQWRVNGGVVGGNSSTLLPGSFVSGDSVTCTVTPHDGTDPGVSIASLAVVISNSPPSIVAVTLSPEPALTSDTLLATPSGWSDPDGDPEGYSYAWTVGGVPAGGNTNTLASVHFASGDSVQCTVTPDDGSDQGAAVPSNVVVISNSPPTAPVSCAIVPPDPVTSDDLVVSPFGSTDPDGDPVSYLIAWERDGVPQPALDGLTTVPAASTTDGEVWTVFVTPTDGATSGPACQDTVTVSSDIPLDDSGRWAAYDAAAVSALVTTGYRRASFDGRYIYFSPSHDGVSAHGRVLRYDTQEGFKDTVGWTAYDAGNSGGLTDTKGYDGSVFDGRYVYFVPDHNGTTPHGKVLRYDSQAPFTASSSWSAYDAGNAGGLTDTKGYVGGVFDGRYVFFVPDQDGTAHHGKVLRYDTQSSFTDGVSWAAYDAGSTNGLASVGYHGAEFDGRYVFFVPAFDGALHHGRVLRYDTQGAFGDVASWTAYDAGNSGGLTDTKGYDGAVFDGRYLYFIPLFDGVAHHGKVLRYDTQAGFGTSGSWAAYDAGTAAPLTDTKGYIGGVFDGRYLYLTPNNDGSAIHGKALRYDSRGAFGASSSWTAYDAGNTDGLVTTGYISAVFDGRYVYHVPYDDGLGQHGRVLRYDSLVPFGPSAQEAYLKASNTEASDRFGEDVAVSGDTLVVSTNREDSGATGVNGNDADNSAQDSGAVYVFRRTGGGWAQEAYLKASNTDANDLFGTSVAISGDTIVVGAWGEDSNATGVNGDETDNSASAAGAVYVFTRSGTVWSQEAYLKASNAESGDAFGGSVGISGDTIVVGASGERSMATGVNGDEADNSGNDVGAAYVFKRTAGVWVQEAYLKASNPGGQDRFGHDVGVSSDTVVVGAYWEDSDATGVNGDGDNHNRLDSGAAYVFFRSGSVWTQQAFLKASNTDYGDFFGQSVAVSGNLVVVGANSEQSTSTGINGNQADNGLPNVGAAYVFSREGSTWSQEAYLKASNADGSDEFGWSVAIHGDWVVVGAIWEDGPDTGLNGNQGNGNSGSGAAYLFTRTNNVWSQHSYLKASNDSGSFGWAVAIEGPTILVGAISESSSATGVNGNQLDTSAPGAGAAYVFR